VTAGDPIRQILRFQIDTLKENNRVLRATNMRLLAERDELREEVERQRLFLPDGLMWPDVDPPLDDSESYHKIFWFSYWTVCIALGLALAIALVLWLR
jgi:hypothetical protein